MKNVGLIIEMEKGEIKETNGGLITLSRQEGMNLTALVLGDMDDSVKEFLSKYGVHQIVSLSVPGAEVKDNPDICARALANAAETLELDILAGLSSGMGRDLIPRTAACMDAPLLMDCVDLDLARNTGITSQYSGKLMAEIELRGRRVLFGVRPNCVKAQEQPGSPDVVKMDLDIETPKGFKVLADETAAFEGVNPVSLNEAEIIVAGGRGMKNKESFDLIFKCAEKMGAAPGASRVAVDQGWVPYAHQVGQTGEKVSPSVYIACGISGSIQHFAGMKTAKMIIAINTDENAAMMTNCDYYVKGDLFEILPELIRQL